MGLTTNIVITKLKEKGITHGEKIREIFAFCL